MVLFGLPPAPDECPASSPDELASQIMQQSGVRGGLVVHVGCGDGRLTAALGMGDGVLVHGLDVAVAKVHRRLAHAFVASEERPGPTAAAIVHEEPASRPWSTLPSYSRYEQLQAEPDAWSWKTHPRFGEDESCLAPATVGSIASAPTTAD